MNSTINNTSAGSLTGTGYHESSIMEIPKEQESSYYS